MNPRLARGRDRGRAYRRGMTVRLRRPSPAAIIACVALFVALGGPAEAAKLINGKLIRKGTVSSKQIRDHGLTTTDLSKKTVRTLQSTPARSIGTGQLADGAVGAAQLQLGSVTAGALAANAITGASLADGAVGTAKIADNSITSEKIGSSQVKKADIATGAVGRSEIAGNSISGNEIANGTLSASDLADFSGSVVPPPPGTLLGGACTTPWVTPVLTPTVAGATLLDDIVLAGHPQSWPIGLSITARPVSATTLDITLCNVTNANITAPATLPAIPFLGIQP